MPDKTSDPGAALIATWAKRCYFAGRAMMEDALRPHGLGATQWHVLQQLSAGPTKQRDLVLSLQTERATVSAIVVTLVAKGLVEQAQDRADQRQKLLRLTPAGEALWGRLPDLGFIRDVAFGEVSAADAAITIQVLKTATERLLQRSEDEQP